MINRRAWIGRVGSLGLAAVSGKVARAAAETFDAVVVGAGVFGIWSAHYLRAAGLRVAVVEAVSPAHSASSSGGESRVTRSGYGDAALYAEWAQRSLTDWRSLSDGASLPLFHPLGVLWLHTPGDELVDATVKTFRTADVPYEMLSARALRARYPVLRVEQSDAGLLEPEAGGLMARRAVQTLAGRLAEQEVTFIRGRAKAVRREQADQGALKVLQLEDGSSVAADRYVMACGPWLDRVCPDAMAERLFTTRQEVFYFGAGRDRTGALPVWADLPFYGLPDLEGRGFKIANDTHGEAIDPQSANRRASEAGEKAARSFLRRRFPTIADAPLTESRVCQYENSSSGDFVIDLHPDFDNVWLVGCGSGHGFKHGPALGAHVAGLVTGREKPIARFSLSSKQKRQSRQVQ